MWYSVCLVVSGVVSCVFGSIVVYVWYSVV